MYYNTIKTTQLKGTLIKLGTCKSRPMSWSYVTIQITQSKLSPLVTVKCHTWLVNITVDTANTKHFHQHKAIWTELLQSGNNLEAGLLRTQTMTLLCVSLSKKTPRAFSLNATFRLEELLSW